MATALYDTLGQGYALRRRADPRVAARMHAALGRARSVLNVGAGAGSYEPADRRVVAAEPSAVMVAQRRPGSAPAVRAAAERLPFASASFDAAMASLTLHHWSDWRSGLREMRRIARRVVVFTWDPGSDGFWLVQEYFPEIISFDVGAFPTIEGMAEVLGPLEVRPVPIPADCTDGFLAAYWRRPETYLDPATRAAISGFARVPDVAPGLARLASDLADGTWAARWGHLLDLDELDCGYRLVVAGEG
jgi:SAM-dependent methyltransferase